MNKNESLLVPLVGVQKSTLLIMKRCTCLRGKKNIFRKSCAYLIRYLYQLPGDGDFMVEVVDDQNLTVQAKANRFDVLKAIANF